MDGRVTALSVIKDETLFSGADDDSICIWDLKSKEQLRSFRDKEYPGAIKEICTIAIDTHYRVFYIVTESHNRKTTTVTTLTTVTEQQIKSVHSIHVWDVYEKSEKRVGMWTRHDAPVESICFHDGRLFSAGNDKSVKVWDYIVRIFGLFWLK